MPNFKPQKLRVNLRLAINRLKMLEKKKTEEAMKARREIADYIKTNRFERARIRVEHIVREDYLVEAMEVVELYCDLLLSRFGLLEQMAYCEDSLAVAVATLIWATPRLSADVQELREISHQLENKFGKQFVQQARSNLSGTVNDKVIHRMGVEAPKKSLVENYMIEIARNYHVEYQPDPSMFLEDDGMPPVAMEKGYIPEASSAPPLPQKQDPDQDRYVPYPGASQQHPLGPPPSTIPPSSHPVPPPTHHIPPPGQGYGAHPPPYQDPQPPANPGLPYPTGPQAGVQPPSLPQVPPAENLDLPPVPNTAFPENSTASEGGDVDFDDLTRRFEELKRRK